MKIIQLTCEQCKQTFEREHGRGRYPKYCSEECKRAKHLENSTTHTARRITHAHGHPLAGTTGLVQVARLVLYDKIGGGSHPCHWCGTVMEWRAREWPIQPGALVVDHLNGNQWDNTPENLVPSCQPCNSRRGRPQEFMVERVCEICGETYKRRRDARSKYCSLTCYRSAQRGAKPQVRSE